MLRSNLTERGNKLLHILNLFTVSFIYDFVTNERSECVNQIKKFSNISLFLRWLCFARNYFTKEWKSFPTKALRIINPFESKVCSEKHFRKIIQMRSGAKFSRVNRKLSQASAKSKASLSSFLSFCIRTRSPANFTPLFKKDLYDFCCYNNCNVNDDSGSIIPHQHDSYFAPCRCVLLARKELQKGRLFTIQLLAGMFFVHWKGL